MNALITGGAGFIGSHLTERLLERGATVTVVDNLSNGNKQWLPSDAHFINGDLFDDKTIDTAVTSELDVVFHLASRKQVDDDDPRGQFRANTAMTADIVDAMLDTNVETVVFTSSSTVYGEAPQPTPEDYAPLEPISTYGASKLAAEGILSTAAHSHELTVKNLRFANIIGSRLRGAVIPDFIQKLRADPETLTILGDGQQQKSYMYIDDCVDAMLHVLTEVNATEPMTSVNLGTRTTTSVNRIADIVAAEMGFDPDYEYTGGDRGWTGDVPKMRLSIEKLSALGWEPKTESADAIRKATRDLLADLPEPQHPTQG